ncbi:hypothetical protein HDU76_008414, partial [Blyttiomyces sp. JEL0837]
MTIGRAVMVVVYLITQRDKIQDKCKVWAVVNWQSAPSNYDCGGTMRSVLGVTAAIIFAHNCFSSYVTQCVEPKSRPQDSNDTYYDSYQYSSNLQSATAGGYQSLDKKKMAQQPDSYPNDRYSMQDDQYHYNSRDRMMAGSTGVSASAGTFTQPTYQPKSSQNQPQYEFENQYQQQQYHPSTSTGDKMGGYTNIPSPLPSTPISPRTSYLDTSVENGGNAKRNSASLVPPQRTGASSGNTGGASGGGGSGSGPVGRQSWQSAHGSFVYVDEREDGRLLGG